MRRFRFRLERLLNVRRLRVQMLQQKVAVARTELQQAEFQLAESQRTYRAASDDLCQREAAGMSAGVLHYGREHLGRLAEAVAAREGGVKAARAVLQDALGELSKARQAEKALERLRERRRREHVQEGLKREQVQLDEVGIARVGREALT